MNAKLTVPLPATCTAWYLVLADMDPGKAREVAMGAVNDYAAASMRERIQEFADGSALSFGAGSEPDIAGMTGEQRDLVRREPGWVSIRVQGCAGAAPVHEWAARTVAGLLASELDVRVLDMMTACLQSADEMLASLHAKENGIMRMADWVRVEPAYGETGWSLATRGMRRYGWPELQVDDIPSWLEDQWCALLTGVAFRVHEELAHSMRRQANAGNWSPSDVQLPAGIEVVDDDVEDAYCLPGSFVSRRYGGRWTSLSPERPEPVFGLALGEGPDGVLTVRPPEELENGWLDPSREIADFTRRWPAVTLAEPFVTRLQKIRRLTPYRALEEALADPDLAIAGS